MTPNFCVVVVMCPPLPPTLGVTKNVKAYEFEWRFVDDNKLASLLVVCVLQTQPWSYSQISQVIQAEILCCLTLEKKQIWTVG